MHFWASRLHLWKKFSDAKIEAESSGPNLKSKKSKTKFCVLFSNCPEPNYNETKVFPSFCTILDSWEIFFPSQSETEQWAGSGKKTELPQEEKI